MATQTYQGPQQPSNPKWFTPAGVDIYRGTLGKHNGEGALKSMTITDPVGEFENAGMRFLPGDEANIIPRLRSTHDVCPPA